MKSLILLFFTFCLNFNSLQPRISPSDEAVVIRRSTFTTSGDFLFSEMQTKTSRSPNDPNTWYMDRLVSQYLGTKQFILPDDVSVADSLNGITWRGRLQFISQAVRRIAWSTKPTDKITYHGWNDWTNHDTITYKMTRFGNADWRIEPLPYNGNHMPVSVSQADIQLVLTRPRDRGASFPPVEY